MPAMREGMKKLLNLMFKFFMILSLLFMVLCEEDKSTLAPYEGQTYLSEITIEKKTLSPKFTWLGGYISAFGINRGQEAALDSTLQWLVHTDGNNLRYPLEYGVVPEGAVDLTSQYGGEFESLIEDSNFTFWVVKAEGWDTIKNNTGKTLLQTEIDSAKESNQDTLFIDNYNYLKKSFRIDIYTNIDTNSIKLRGGLAKINLIETDTSNSPVVTWEIIDDDFNDSLISATGICEGVSYDPTKIVWEAWSVDTVDGETMYGSKNVIRQPLIMGQDLPGTRVFTQFPEQGLERNKNYLFWIAGEGWNGEDHLRFTKYHAYITFQTW